MPDTPFKSMTPEPSGLPKSLKHLRHLGFDPGQPVKCDQCGSNIFTGDWPWCGGDSTKHNRD